jgi:hypothetical protein
LLFPEFFHHSADLLCLRTFCELRMIHFLADTDSLCARTGSLDVPSLELSDGIPSHQLAIGEQAARL